MTDKQQQQQQQDLPFPYPTTSSNHIQPEQAKALFDEHCAFLILEQLPIASEFGLDLNLNTIGEKFKGVKLIPPGIHFIYASSAETGQAKSGKRQSGPRCGLFHCFEPKEVLVLRWSTAEEEFDLTFKPDEDYLQRYKGNLKEIDRYLACYNFETYETFLGLTSKLTTHHVESLMPACNIIRSIPYLTTNQAEQFSSSSKRIKRFTTNPSPSEDDLLPEFKPDIKTVINFTKIIENHLDAKSKVANELITQYNLDATFRFEETFCEDLDKFSSRVSIHLPDLYSMSCLRLL